jgi:hypothetical protein
VHCFSNGGWRADILHAKPTSSFLSSCRLSSKRQQGKAEASPSSVTKKKVEIYVRPRWQRLLESLQIIMIRITEDVCHPEINRVEILEEPITVAALSKSCTVFARSHTEIVVFRIRLEAWMFVCVYSVFR